MYSWQGVWIESVVSASGAIWWARGDLSVNQLEDDIWLRLSQINGIFNKSRVTIYFMMC